METRLKMQVHPTLKPKKHVEYQSRSVIVKRSKSFRLAGSLDPEQLGRLCQSFS